MSLAQLGREMATAYLGQIGYRVEATAPDGWCLLSCVQLALGEDCSRTQLLRDAVAWIRDASLLENLDEALRREVVAQAEEVAQMPSVGRHIERLWNTSLWDLLPHALSALTGRPLFIYATNIDLGMVRLTVVDEAPAVQSGRSDEVASSRHGTGEAKSGMGGGGKEPRGENLSVDRNDDTGGDTQRDGISRSPEAGGGVPIRMLYSGSEYGCGHYDSICSMETFL